MPATIPAARQGSPGTPARPPLPQQRPRRPGRPPARRAARRGPRPAGRLRGDRPARGRGARMDSLAADLAARTARDRARGRRQQPAPGRPPAGRAARNSAGSGHRARCTEPGCHQDHTSSVTNGRNGANSRSSARQRQPQRGRAPRRPGRRRAPVRPGLDQLHVVVAEEPEELLGQLQRPGVLVRLERRRGLAATAASRASSARSSGSVTGASGLARRSADLAPAARPARTCSTFSILMASRRPTFSCAGSNAVSVPSRALAAQYRTASEPYCAQQVHRGHHVALGLGHLLPVRVEDPAGDRGVPPGQHAVLGVRAQHRVEQPGPDDLVRLRPQVHREHPAGTGRRRVPQPPAICGVSDDVAQVSITSGSPVNPPGWPRCVLVVAGRRLGRRVDRQRVLGGARIGAS